jgi:hypothetical protein
VRTTRPGERSFRCRGDTLTAMSERDEDFGALFEVSTKARQFELLQDLSGRRERMQL